VLQLSFLNGVAIAAALTVLITMFASLTLLPALLDSRRPRLEPARAPFARDQWTRADRDHSRWQRWANTVTEHPRKLSLVAAHRDRGHLIPFSPCTHSGVPTRERTPLLNHASGLRPAPPRGFGPGSTGRCRSSGRSTTPRTSGDGGARPEACRESPIMPSRRPCRFQERPGRLIYVVPKSSPDSRVTENLIAKFRNDYIPAVTTTTHTGIYVGGLTAIFVDFAQVFTSKIPLFVGVIVLLGCLLLMVAFRSIVIP